jgi:hypothetical protein
MAIVRDAIARLLDRANAAGRTAVRCIHCGRQITRNDCDCSYPWVDEYGLATCPAFWSRLTPGRNVGHEPPAVIE